LRKRGELVERSFAHAYETGGMRRTHLRGHPNILKRLLIHICGFNLALLMRGLFGMCKPRGNQGAPEPLFGSIFDLLRGIAAVFTAVVSHVSRFSPREEWRADFVAETAA